MKARQGEKLALSEDQRHFINTLDDFSGFPQESNSERSVSPSSLLPAGDASSSDAHYDCWIHAFDRDGSEVLFNTTTRDVVVKHGDDSERPLLQRKAGQPLPTFSPVWLTQSPSSTPILTDHARFVLEERLFATIVRIRNGRQPSLQDETWRHCAIYDGLSGIGYAMLRVSAVLKDVFPVRAETRRPSAVAIGRLGHEYLRVASHQIKRETKIEIETEAETDDNKKKNPTFLDGVAGVLSVAAAVTNDATTRDRLIEKVLEVKKLLLTDENEAIAGMSCDVMCGAGGFLLALAALGQNEAVGGTVDEPRYSSAVRETAQKVAEAVVAVGRTRANSETPLLFACQGKCFVGAAHGTAGVIMALLHWIEELSDESQEWIRECVDYLCTKVDEAGGVSYREGRLEAPLTQWCHGAPGLCMVLCRAYEVFDDELHKVVALLLGQCTWQRGLLTKGSGLCHGTSGTAYALLSCYRITQDPLWLHRACQVVHFSSSAELDKCHFSMSDAPYSLNGLAGLACIYADLLRKDVTRARFPGFEVF